MSLGTKKLLRRVTAYKICSVSNESNFKPTTNIDLRYERYHPAFQNVPAE